MVFRRCLLRLRVELWPPALGSVLCGPAYLGPRHRHLVVHAVRGNQNQLKNGMPGLKPACLGLRHVLQSRAPAWLPAPGVAPWSSLIHVGFALLLPLQGWWMYQLCYQRHITQVGGRQDYWQAGQPPCHAPRHSHAQCLPAWPPGMGTPDGSTLPMACLVP